MTGVDQLLFLNNAEHIFIISVWPKFGNSVTKKHFIEMTKTKI